MHMVTNGDVEMATSPDSSSATWLYILWVMGGVNLAQRESVTGRDHSPGVHALCPH